MNGINGLFILIAAGCLGMFLHYAKKAMMRELWQGDTEPNPLRWQFWVDFYLYMVVEHPGRTCGAIVACIGTAFVLARTVGVPIATADPWDLLALGVASGFIGDSFNKTAS